MAAKREPPAAGTAATTDPGATPPTGSRAWRLGAGLFVVAALATAAYLGWRGYEQWTESEPATGKPEAPQPETARLAAMSEDLHALHAQVAGETRQREQLQAAVAELKATLDRETAARRMTMPDADTLAVMEVDHLLRLASLQIWEARSPAPALALLERADTLLAPLTDPAVEPVRAAVIADTAALRLAGTVDIEGLYLRLGALQTAIATLNPTPRPAPAPDTAPERTPAPVGFWPRLLSNAGAALRRFSAEHLRVRTLDAPPPALLSRAGEARLRQYLELLLSQAQLAVLEREERIYRDALARAAQLLDVHFGFDARTPALRAEFAALQAQPVTLSLPDVSQSRERVRDYLAGAQQRRAGAASP